VQQKGRAIEAAAVPMLAVERASQIAQACDIMDFRWP
jgi:hypothetical protein